MAKKYKKVVVKNKKKEVLTALQKKRVTIAKDALKQVQLEKYKVLSGNGYVVNDELEDEINTLQQEIENKGEDSCKVELREHLDSILGKVQKCEVCAKGALFLSAIRKFNNFSLSDASWDGVDGEASDQTRKIFGRKNADLIENYFEHSDPYKYFDNDSYKWSYGYEDDERLILILKNVIENKGTFKPNKLKWKNVEEMEAMRNAY